MPPKLPRRPAARLVVAKAKAKVKAKARPKAAIPSPKAGVARRGNLRLKDRRSAAGEEGWMDLAKVGHSAFPLQSILHLHLIYRDEQGQVIGRLMEVHKDVEGDWLSIAVEGTTIPSLRTWRLSHTGGNDLLYVCYQEMRPEKRLTLEYVAYLTKVRKLSAISEDWGKNCVEERPGPVETKPLQDMAAQFGRRFPRKPKVFHHRRPSQRPRRKRWEGRKRSRTCWLVQCGARRIHRWTPSSRSP